MSKYGVFSGPNTGKYEPEKTRYLDTFHAVHSYKSTPKQAQQNLRQKVIPIIREHYTSIETSYS